jgi:hypothetical protein
MSLRIRQLVIAANSLESADMLRHVLGLGTPYADPGVGEFGLTNAVFALGDQFLEVIVPTTDTAPARRFIDRNGEGGYMAIFQVPDLTETRAQLDKLGMRRVWNSDFDDIRASHIHPADIGGAIVSIDQPIPAGEWRWGGPDWKTNTVNGAISGATLTSPTPSELAAKWGDALGQSPESKTTLQTDDGAIRFEDGKLNALTRFHITLPDPQSALQRAQASGLETRDQNVRLAGVWLNLS